MLDLSITKLLVLAVLALVIFGPDQLPKMAGQAGRAIRDLRQLAAKARADLTDGLGPELTGSGLAGSGLAGLDPRSLLPAHLLGDLGDLGGTAAPSRPGDAAAPPNPLAEVDHDSS